LVDFDEIRTLELGLSPKDHPLCNISKYGLNDNKKKVRSKGLNYAVTPDRIAKEEYIVATEKHAKCY